MRGVSTSVKWSSGLDYTLMFVDIMQTTLPADPLKFPPEVLHFECLQSLDFLAFLEEFFFFTSLSAFSSFFPCRVLATDD